MKFTLGKITVSLAAATAIRITDTHLFDLLTRHMMGDSGKAPEDFEMVLARKEQVISVYPLPGSNLVIWIVTAPDGSATTITIEGEDSDAV